MKHTLRCFVLTLFTIFVNSSMRAQNADQLIFNQYLQSYSFAGGSFIIDTGKTVNAIEKRAFLIWSANVQPDSLKRYLSLSEYGYTGNFINERVMPFHKNASLKTLFPKKIIKSKFSRSYYMLGYNINSSHLLSGLTVYSSPVVYKIDANTLNMIWSRRVQNAVISPNTVNTVIEYNDIIETSDGNVVLAGKYAANTTQKEYVLATKLLGVNGALSWVRQYFFGNSCNEGATSIAQTTDGNISVTGYVKRCTPPSLTGANDMFYVQITTAGNPIAGTYKKFQWTGTLNLTADKITRYTNILGADKLVVSGYVDQPRGTSYDRQILIANINQNGTPINWFHIGDSLADVANDLIFQQITGTTDYYLYLTGYTSNYVSVTAKRTEVYYLQLKFNAAAGVTGLVEFSTFPVTTLPYNNNSGRVGLEIKNASYYKRFAILATGIYKPTTLGSQTYTDVLIRDLSDTTGKCIRQFQPPIKQFGVQYLTANYDYTIPSFKVYKDSWLNLGPLFPKQICQQLYIDSTGASLAAPQTAASASDAVTTTGTKASIFATPNPVKSLLTLSTANGEALTGKAATASINIYSSSMQLVQTVKVTQTNKNLIVIPVNTLTPGLYFVQLIQPGAVKTVKFIKE